MTNKILFWADSLFIQFGIAKSLQEKYGCELFAIYDVTSFLKNLLKKQKIVKFQKEWFFWDYVKVTKKNPDIKYLEQFEKKFRINIWMFSNYEALFSKKNQYHKFSHDEILSIFEQECRFFEQVLEEIKPNFLVIKFTDYHRNHLLKEMCSALGIKVLMLTPTIVGNRSRIINEYNIQHDLSKTEIKSENVKSFSELREYIKKYNKFLQSKKIIAGGGKNTLVDKTKITLQWMKTSEIEDMSRYDYYNSNKSKVLTTRFLNGLRKKQRESFIDKNFEYEIDNDENFVYFPLQVEPERSLNIDAPFYVNQLEIIKNISKSLPVGYKLFVKEHYGQIFRNWREIKYYKEIMSLPNVKLIHHSIKPEEIIKKCKLVLSISGTSGFEAALYEKPSIVFADVNYESLESVNRVKQIEDLPNLIRNTLKQKVNLLELNKFISRIEIDSFEFDEIELQNIIYDKFHSGGLALRRNITMEDLQSFLEDQKKKFDSLALEHIKKIQK